MNNYGNLTAKFKELKVLASAKRDRRRKAVQHSINCDVSAMIGTGHYIPEFQRPTFLNCTVNN